MTESIVLTPEAERELAKHLSGSGRKVARRIAADPMAHMQALVKAGILGVSRPSEGHATEE